MSAAEQLPLFIDVDAPEPQRRRLVVVEYHPAVEAEEPLPERPRTRAGCEAVPRPCPYVSCRMNLYLDALPDGRLKLRFPDKEPDEMVHSCALDIADEGPHTLEQVGAVMGFTREAARQAEEAGAAKMAKRMPADATEVVLSCWERAR